MAFSPFTAGLFTAGQILTAAQMNTYIRDNIMAGGPVYASEAARNADIPTPFEGQRAYITGSTVATATGQGGTAGVPTGIQTIHNGSSTPTYAANWVCVTPVGATSTTTGTTVSTSYATTLTGDATAVSVTLSTGTTALVSIASMVQPSVSGSLAFFGFSVSGASTVAAAGPRDTQIQNTALYYSMAAKTVIMSGLTAGTNTFTLAYRVQTGNTATYDSRTLAVQGIA